MSVVKPNGSIVQCDESRFRFQRSFADRTLGLFGGALGLGFGLLLLGAVLADARGIGGLGVTVLMLPCLAMMGVGAAFLFAAGPCEMDCDLRQRTYRFRKGWPFFAGTRTGPLTDFRAISVRTMKVVTRYGVSPTEHRIYLAWTQAPQSGIVLQPLILIVSHTQRQTADAWGNEIAQLMRLPLESV